MIRRPPRSTPFPTRRSSDLIEATGPCIRRHGDTRLWLAYGHYRNGILGAPADRKSTRLNSSHLGISYAVFCLKKKKQTSHENFTVSALLSTSLPPESAHVAH